ncbi:MAG: carboxypeptidase regulatory-like domain-containing protein [Euryarchaeota archaeon]|nr:carboxypeptidase regulatory-like domain-containing protein [Euryarchaeota archaeon]
MIVTAALVLSGCAGGQATPQAAPSTTAPPPTVSADAGSIAGQVTDDAMVAVEGADVAVSGPGEGTAKTDANGKFTFNDLTPGAYTVAVQKLGFDSAAKKVTVVAGEAVQVAFVIAAIAIESEPRVDYEIRGGYIEGPSLYTPAVTYRPVQTFPVNMTRGARDAVLALAWVANSPTSAKFMYEALAYDGQTNSTWGKSPRVVRLSEMEVDKAKDKATATWYLHFACTGSTLTPQCFVDNAPDSVLPVVVMDQRVTFYSSVFYNQAAADDYTGLPP